MFIAGSGYGLYEQAFFPFYPLLIRAVSSLPVPPVYAGLLISHIAFFLGLLLFYDFALRMDKKSAVWSVLLLLAFPTSFFFAAVYPTSLYFLLTVAAFTAIEKRKWLFAGVLGFLASLTRIYGAFLIIPAALEYIRLHTKIAWKVVSAIGLIPLGLVVYMTYLYISFGDALSFIRVQSAFGAQRNTDKIVLLPQVLWRYAKIFTSVSPVSVEYGIAVLEIVTFVFFLYLLLRAFNTRLNTSFILYCGIVLIVPTLTGTLTSVPRYVLDAFPLFIVMGMAHNTRVKAILLFIMLVGLVICTSLFLQGYFVA